jgi:ADP-ribose pyrophosphatase
MSSAKKNSFKQLKSKLIYRARLFHLNQVTMKAPDGHTFRHEVIHHPGAAVVVPVLKGEQFVLVKQYRTAVKRAIWEFPAGTLEAGESPMACAKREIIEETGFEARKWRKLTSFYPAPGISTEYMHIYLGTDLVPARMSLDRDEFIERHIVSFKRLQKMILSGMIMDAKTIIGFFCYCEKIRGRKRR